MMFFNCFSGLLLTVLATQASAGTFPSSAANCPAPGRLNLKLQNLLDSLQAITINLQGAVNITEIQCPCVGGDPACFETKAEDLLSGLQQLTTDVEAAQTNVSFECPDRTGTVLVATCNTTEVIVVDPNGFIQNSLETEVIVERWTLARDAVGADGYALDYYRNDPLQIRCKPVPGIRELTLGQASNLPASSMPRATGVAVDINNIIQLYVAITFANPGLNGIYALSRLNPGTFTLICNYDGQTGDIFICSSYIYMNDGQKVVKKHVSAGTWEDVLVFSVPPVDLVVQDDGSVVFCDDVGGVWVYDPVTLLYRQLKEPNDQDCCSSIKINPCDSLVYVAFKNDPNIQIYNATSFVPDGSVTYTETTPSPCPRIEFDPRFCCA